MKSWIRYLFQSDFLKKCISVFGAKYAAYFVSLVLSVFTARVLGPENKGIQGTILSISGMLAQFGTFGLISANTYYIAKKREQKNAVMNNTYMVTFFTVLSFVFAGVLAPLWIGVAFFDERTFFMAVILAAWQLLAMYQQNCLIALDRIADYAKGELLYVFLNAGIVALVFLLGKLNVYKLIWISCFSCMCQFFYSWKKSGIKVGFGYIDGTILKRQFSYGSIVYIITFLQYMIVRCDVFMIGHFLGNRDIGYYTVAVSLIDAINVLFVSVGNLIFPEVAAMEDESASRIFMRKMLLLNAAAAAGIVAMGLLVSKPMIIFLYGQEYKKTASVFLILLFGLLFRGLATLENNFLAGRNENGRILIVVAGCFVLNIVLNASAIPSIGIQGAAIASDVTYFAMFLFTSWMIFARKGSGTVETTKS